MGNQENWKRLADDILPANATDEGIQLYPHFPQLKIPPDKQPGLNFPEILPLDKICLLNAVEKDAPPKINLLPKNQAIQALLSHTAGTRLFTPELLAKHLHFSAKVAQQVPVYRLDYPHRKNALPFAKNLLEKICSH